MEQPAKRTRSEGWTWLWRAFLLVMGVWSLVFCDLSAAAAPRKRPAARRPTAGKVSKARPKPGGRSRGRKPAKPNRKAAKAKPRRAKVRPQAGPVRRVGTPAKSTARPAGGGKQSAPKPPSKTGVVKPSPRPGTPSPIRTDSQNATLPTKPFDPTRATSPTAPTARLAAPPVYASQNSAGPYSDRVLVDIAGLDLATWQNRSRALSAAGLSPLALTPALTEPDRRFMRPGDAALLETSPVGEGPDARVVATPEWSQFFGGYIKELAASGVSDFVLDSAVLPVRAGYSEGFKGLWQALFNRPWEAPHQNAGAYYHSGRLHAESIRRLIDSTGLALQGIRVGDRAPRMLVSVRSPLELARRTLAGPVGSLASARLDGFLGRASQPRSDLSPTAFTEAFAEYSYFSNLTSGLGDRNMHVSLPLSAEAASEAGPWVAGLLSRDIDGYVIEENANSTLASRIIGALRDLPALPSRPIGGSPGAGILVFDSLSWQREGDADIHLRGLVQGLVAAGLAPELLPGERAIDPGLLNRFKLLFLTCDPQKPTGPEIGEALGTWVRAGGTLVLLGGTHPSNSVGGWWSEGGYASAQDQVIKAIGAGVEPLRNISSRVDASFRELARSDDDRVRRLAIPLQPAAKSDVTVMVRALGSITLRRFRVLEGDAVRADFRPGGPGESALLADACQSSIEERARKLRSGGEVSYRLKGVSPDAVLELELDGPFSLLVGQGIEPWQTLKPSLSELQPVRVPVRHALTYYPLFGATPLWQVSEDVVPGWRSVVGAGSVIFCGVSPAWAAESRDGLAWLRGLARFAAQKAEISNLAGGLLVRRGPYLVGHSLERKLTIAGQFVDLLDPELRLLEGPDVPLRAPILWKEIPAPARLAQVAFARHRSRTLEQGNLLTTVETSGPVDTPGCVIIQMGGMGLAGIRVTDELGTVLPPAEVKLSTVAVGRVLRATYRQCRPRVRVTFRWNKPEERLTK